MLSVWVSGGATVDLELGGKGAKDAPTVPQMLMLNPIKNIYLVRQPWFGNLRVRQPLVRQPLGGIPHHLRPKLESSSTMHPVYGFAMLYNAP